MDRNILFLAAKLPHLDRMNEERRRIAGLYLEGIRNPLVTLPYVPAYAQPVWHIFGIRCDRRAELEKFLNDAGIPIIPELRVYTLLGKLFPGANVISLSAFPDITFQIFICIVLKIGNNKAAEQLRGAVNNIPYLLFFHDQF